MHAIIISSYTLSIDGGVFYVQDISGFSPFAISKWRIPIILIVLLSLYRTVRYNDKSYEGESKSKYRDVNVKYTSENEQCLPPQKYLKYKNEPKSPAFTESSVYVRVYSFSSFNNVRVCTVDLVKFS